MEHRLNNSENGGLAKNVEGIEWITKRMWKEA
ncbi:hypothetical protein BBR47_44410 [Brevibacillus brevis NBRC 100599]|uniref:Uncharacterized protein n=1 Tax=Brevibacillus brevis (strain 47 / JCM 6285 / NBRC 100599) TaxID=358681 RepID=C0ZJ43_BREBN|nr:hypothetical protein BBR47_44410 [Brevibacillus brevis NBRC 100599]